MTYEIGTADKILIIASNPDDIVIACGGFICKHRSQIDLMCVCRSQKGAVLSSKNSVQTKYNDFCLISKHLGINKFFIEKPNDENSTDSDYENYLSNFNMKDYDLILLPHKGESDPEHSFVFNTLGKIMLEKQGYKESLKILLFELHTPLKEPNYFENISDIINEKKELVINCKGGGSSYAESVISLNKFRTFSTPLAGKAEYVEAYKTEELYSYLELPDIIDKNTDIDFKNEEIEKFLKENDAQSKIDDLASRFSGRKIIVFGAGSFARCVFKNYDLSKLNIVAIADRRFEENRPHEFYGLNCIKPQDIKSAGADLLLIAALDFVKFYDMLNNTILKDFYIEMAPLIRTSISSFNKIFEGKVCAHPFHIVSIVPTGHCVTCCPAYIRNFVIGNLYENDFSEIWNGRRATHLRNALMNDDYTICDMKTCIYPEFRDKGEMTEFFDEKGQVKPPDTILMSWDYDCNVACITCRNDLIKNDENTLKGFNAIESKILDACNGVKYFYASGNGDPFGSSYARNIIKKIAENNPHIKFLIHTNGVLCNEKICNELGITNRMQSITFSIHAACKETYDKIVRYGNFDSVLKNLEWVSSLKQKGLLESITMVFVVHKLNYKDMPDFVRMAEKYNATASFRYYRQWAHNTEFKYEEMAVFDKSHPEHSKFVEMLQDKIFDSKNCSLDPSLRFLRENK